jgi:response regulator RpfG family c-di-GMP phosphodiesterase
MKIDSTFFKSKIGTRIIILFICCALFPISALAIISFNHVVKQLNNQSYKRLHQESKAMGMSIIERLSFLEAELKLISSNIRVRSDPSILRNDERLKLRFKSLTLVTDLGESVFLMGRIQFRVELSPAQKKHLTSGKAIIMTQHQDGYDPSIYMIIAFDPRDLIQGLIYAEINSMYLWGLAEFNTLPSDTKMCVLGESDNVIFSSSPVSSTFSKKLSSEIRRSPMGKFEWKDKDQEYFASYWSIFLKYQFFIPEWTVVMSVSKINVLAPMANFKKIFPLVLLASFCFVLLLSIIQIRKSLGPLNKLKEGTKRIAMKEFSSRVIITSNDEFEELAESFNTMATTLGKQFNALSTMAEIDRAILSSLNTVNIINRILVSVKKLFTCDFASVTLLDAHSENIGKIYIRDSKPDDMDQVENINLTSEELKKLRTNTEWLLLNGHRDLPSHLIPFVKNGIKEFLILPIFLKDKLAGIITLGFKYPSVLNDDDLLQVRQLADQMAIALSNARLVKELDQLNWGALTALARAVDAKSPWTAGHSERVTKISLQIGRKLGLSQKEIDDMHRGGLLHDIGKIGIPAKILDKPGKLTDDEYRIVREHPCMGGRILEPINAFTDIIVFVLQHHERFDGKGYPDGLSGEDISLGARIMAVADVFDALISDRPYRAGRSLEEVIDIIKQEKGKHFDPKVVQVLLEIIEKERMAGEKLEITNQSAASSI